MSTSQSSNNPEQLNVVELLTQLINTHSVTGTESQVGQFLFDHLSSLGFEVSKHMVEHDRFNVLATIGVPRVLLQAHMDVVPPHISARQDDERVYGRGACDTKGSIASMITAARLAREQGVTDFGLLFTVDEEMGFAGVMAAAPMVREMNVFVVVGEPTRLQPVTAHFGFTSFRVVCSGRAVHSSEPQLGVNAIDTLISVLSGPMRQFSTHPQTLSSVVMISGGVADNVIPDRADALYSLRVAPGDTRDYVAEAQQLVGDQASIELVQTIPSVASHVPDSLSFLGEGLSIKGCTELSYFQNGLILGPGNIADAHTDEESVLIADLNRAVELYQRILTEY